MKKNTRNQTLRLLLYAGAVYFAAVAIVHALGVKVPGHTAATAIATEVQHHEVIATVSNRR